jgi:orotidine-5'-phosphate decarboxylase
MEGGLPEYKSKFIEYLLNEKSLKFGDFILKSKRSSPYFFNAGDLNDGLAISKLGEAFAGSIMLSDNFPDVLFGPSYKGISLAISTSIALAEKGRNIGFSFDRKEVKNYGEATSADLQKTILVGSEIKDNQKIVIVEDVFTTGQTKYETIALLNRMAKGLKISYILIVFDRQEIGIDGKNAVDEFVEKTGIPVKSVVSISDALQYLKLHKSKYEKEIFRIENYLRVYGTSESKSRMKVTPQKIIPLDRSIIAACDIQTLEELNDLVKNTHEVEGLGGYKIGFELGLGYGLKEVVTVIKKYTNKPIIYDHQKAGTDIPDTGKNFAQVCKRGGVDSVIFFPQAGPETERAWIYHALNENLSIIVGGRMTHPAFAKSEGGFITDEGALEIYRIAAKAGINDFVVPGNKPEVIEEVKKVIVDEKIEPIFYSPGFIAQGGKLSDTVKVAGDKFHPIVGRGIYRATDKHSATKDLCNLLI